MSKKEYPNIPGYQIKKVLGEGGMGIVFLALQTSLDREVALKVTLPALAEMDASFTKRFVREARATAALNHKNIITVFDAGEFEQSSYLAMEYIATGTLTDVDRSKLSDEEICQLFIGITQGLGSAHKAGFVHRDVKPDNILINKYGRPVVTDFGIVKSLGTKNTALTIAGGTIGTPQYMSPEQIKAEDLDGRSDLYSIGVMLYNLLEGHAPFSDPTPSAVYIMHVTTDPPPLSLKNSLFQTIVTRLLKKSPNERYKDASELILELKTLSQNIAKGIAKIQVDSNIAFVDTEVNLDDEKFKNINKIIVKKTATSKPIKNRAYQTSLATKINHKQETKKLVKTAPMARKYIDPKTSMMDFINPKIVVITISFLFVLLSIYFILSQSEKDDLKPNLVQQPNEVLEGLKNLTDKNNWLKAQKGNSRSSYVEYIASHPNGMYLKLAQENLSRINATVKTIDTEETKKGTISVNKPFEQEEIQPVITKKQIQEQDKDLNKELTDSNAVVIREIKVSSELTKEKESVGTKNQVNEPVKDNKIIKEVKQRPSVPPIQTRVSEKLSLARVDIDNFKLLKPTGNNAHEKLLQILEIDPENYQAKEMLLEIINKYYLLSKNNKTKRGIGNAIDYINNAIKLRENYLAKGFDRSEYFEFDDRISLQSLRLVKSELLGFNDSLVAIESKRKEQEKLLLLKQKEARQVAQFQENKQINLPEANFKKGKRALEEGDYSIAKEWFEKAALENHAKSQDRLGTIYYEGRGVRKSESKAVEWYLKAANQNYASAQDHMGLMYYKGFGVNRSYKKAFEWFKKAGDQGYAESQWNLGVMYENGKGVRRNEKQAIKWYRKAAIQGNNLAIERLKANGIEF